ncbi:hypothetical protein [Kribbella sp. NPDC055071]
MTDLLNDILTEQADSVGEPNIDVAAVMRTGTQRRKRRRLAAAVSVVAATAVVVGGGTLAVRKVSAGESNAPVSSTATNRANTAASPYAERRATWALGNTIHYGADVLKTNLKIASFVQTDAGFVVTGTDGFVYRVAGRDSKRIGGGNTSHLLAADDIGAIVGWVDMRPPVPEFVLYDAASDREVGRTAIGNRRGDAKKSDPVRVAAIDDGVAYLAASDGLHRWTIVTGTDPLIKAGAATSLLQAAGNGQLVWERPAAEAGNDLAVGPDIAAANPKHFEGWHANLSPSARYLLTDKADVARLFDVRSDRQLDLKYPGYNLIAPTQWAGDEKFFAVGFGSDESAPLDLLSCSTKVLTCTVATPKFASSQAAVVYPIGVPNS